MPTPDIASYARRVKNLIDAHPDVDHVELKFKDAGRKIVLDVRHVDAQTSTDQLLISFHYNLLTKSAWKDIESVVIQQLNHSLAAWQKQHDEQENVAAPLPHEMEYQDKAKENPLATAFGPYTPEQIAEAKQTAKDRLWGAPTDHPVVMALRLQYKEAMVNLLLNTRPSRRQSLALSDLEQSLMWAIKAVFEKE